MCVRLRDERNAQLTYQRRQQILCVLDVQHSGLLFCSCKPMKVLTLLSADFWRKRTGAVGRLWCLKLRSFRHVPKFELGLDLSDVGSRGEFSSLNKTWRLLHVGRGDAGASPLSLPPDPYRLTVHVSNVDMTGTGTDLWSVLLINYTLGELRINEWRPGFDHLLSRRTKGKGIWRRKGAPYFLSWGGQMTNYKVFVFLCNRYVTENRL